MSVDSTRLRGVWSEVKTDYALNGPNVKHWQTLAHEIYKMLWGAKFDDKVPDLARVYGKFQRTNVQTQIEATPIYDIGGMLAFAAPLMIHEKRTCAFQFVCEVPISVQTIELGRKKLSAFASVGGLPSAGGAAFSFSRTHRDARENHPRSDRWRVHSSG